MIPGQNALAQLCGSLFGLVFGLAQSLLCFVLGYFVGVIVAVEMGESFEVSGGPGMFALKKLVHFALRGRSVVDGSCVGIFRCTDLEAGVAESLLCLPKTKVRKDTIMTML